MKRILLPILVIGILLLNACADPSALRPFPPPAPPSTEETTPEAEALPTSPPTEETALEVEATPTPTTHTLSVTVSPSEAGSVSPSGGQYGEGSQVTLTATPASGYTFDYWHGDASGSSVTISIIMDSNRSVTAQFKVTEPEPTPAPPTKPEIQGVTTYFDRDYFYIVGEILNMTNSNINFVKVVATYYDETGTVIGTEYTYTGLDIILPNDAAPFDISSYPDKIQPASYKLSADYNTTSEQPFAGLNVKSDSASIDDRGYHKIVGEVENTSLMSAEFVRVVATYYNSDGDIIGTDYTYTEIDIVGAGDTAPFELSSYPRKIKPASYKLHVQGSEH